MIDEAAKLVAKKTGLSQDKAKQAVLIVLDVIKQKLPAVAPQIDALASGGDALSEAGKLAGGLFGKK